MYLGYVQYTGLYMEREGSEGTDEEKHGLFPSY